MGDGRTVRLISLGGSRTDRLLARVSDDIPGAVAAVEKFWGTKWDREIVIIATDSDPQFIGEAGLDPREQWTDIAAVSVADAIDFNRHQATGQRIVLAPGADAMSDSALQIVLTHELFHFAARADTALDAPRWLLEGVADFVARPPTPIPADAVPAEDAGALPTDADLDAQGSERTLGYDRAWWFARFIADTYGVDKLKELYVVACSPGHPDFSLAVQSTLDTDAASVSGQWAQWLSRGAR